MMLKFVALSLSVAVGWQITTTQLGPTPAPGSPPPHPAAWLVGCWELTSANGTVEESWLPERAGVMLGVSRSWAGEAFRSAELVLLKRTGPQLHYEAHPSDEPATTFEATRITDTLLVFENPGHDFPTLIGYRRVGSDSLVAWIEGRGKRIDFAYRRKGC